MEDMRCCGNCKYYTGDFCYKEWNNADQDYLAYERDSREPNETCEDWRERT